MKPILAAILAIGTCAAQATAAAANPEPRTQNPIPLIFDTDMGNDVDDTLALGMIHALQSRGHCRLIAVTSTKDHPLSAPFIDAVNTFYGRGDIPVGAVRGGVTPEKGKYLGIIETIDDGRPRYPHDLRGGADAPDAVSLLRKALAAEADGSVAIAQVGFSSNLARLLDSPADAASPLSGRDLVAKKVRLLSLMFGAFQPIKGKTHKEYNVIKDIPAAKKLVAEWPGPMVFSGFEIGIAIPYPAESILRDYRYEPHHPLVDSYAAYMPPPHCRPTWDLTSVLYAVWPDRGYFGLSGDGTVSVADDGVTTFAPSPGGGHRYLTATPDQVTRATEAFVQLCSQPPPTKSQTPR
ncbi:MAG: nucleoside hydrolase [Verrucomicrobiae bacterium]|nr:nucleoside hydrolase [Verrucomicrobiae bacterium]